MTKSAVVNLYSIKDLGADEFGPVFAAKTDAVAIRAYKQMLVKNGVEANEFVLHLVAEFDYGTGKINPLRVAPVYVGGNEVIDEGLKK